MRRVLIRSNGCEQRLLDAEYFQRKAKESGDVFVDSIQDANVILYVSCCVSRAACQTAIREITDCHNTGLPVTVYGCLPGVESDWLDSLGIVHYSSSQREQLLADMGWKSRTSYPVLNRQDTPDIQHTGETPRMQFDCAKRGKKLVVCDGCLNQCAYCAIRFSTGRLKSRPIPDIIQTWKENVFPGDHVMLMGGDTGAYGLDLGTNLPQLLHALRTFNTSADIFLHDLNIRWMRQYLKDFIREIGSQSFVRGLVLPIQSGSDGILAAMKRHYTVEDIMQCFRLLRNTDASLLLGTHVIVGFPGETESSFEATVRVLLQLPLDCISCFPYSEHKKAPSSGLFPKVPRQVVDERINRLATIFGEKLKLYP